MAQIRVKRKAHTRKAYTRKNSVRVKASSVEASTFKVKDRGEPGKTPERERWFVKGPPTGWRKDQPAATRRRLALKAHKGDLLATARSLMALHNVQTDKQTKKLARQDADYFFKLYRRK